MITVTIAGLCIAALSFCLGALIIMASMNHPTGGPSAAGPLVLCAIGFVVGLVVAAIGGVAQLIG